MSADKAAEQLSSRLAHDTGQGRAGHGSDVMAAGEGNLSRIHWHDPSSRQEGPGEPHHLGAERGGTWAGKVPSCVFSFFRSVLSIG